MDRKKVLLILLILTLLAPIQVAARGNPDVGLPKVDRLIKDRNYNEAILELAKYMTETPEDFDGAQRRIRKIINMREDYNDQALILLLVLANEPTNDQKKLDMINYLESLEKNPNKSTSEFITQTKSAAQFTYYRAKFDEIMNEGDLLIDQGLYVDAARKFTEGYVFYKNEFDEESDPELVSKINARLGNIMNSMGPYATLQETFIQALTGAETAIGTGNHAESVSALARLDSELEQLGKVRNGIAEHGWYFSDTFDEAQSKNQIVTDNSFLPFAWRFTLGRKTAGRYEGILGAMDAQWNQAMDRVEKVTEDAVWANWHQGYEMMGAGSIESANVSLDKARRFASLGKAFPAGSSRFTRRPDTFGMRDPAKASERYGRIETLIDGMTELGRTYEGYLSLRDRIDSVAVQQPAPELLRAGQSTTVRAFSSLLEELSSISKRFTQIVSTADAMPTVGAYTMEYKSRRDELASSIDRALLDIYLGISGFQERSALTMADEWTSVHDEGLRLLEGTPSGEAGAIQYFPGESLVAFNKVKNGISSDRKVLQNIIASMEKVPAPVLADAEYAADVNSVKASLARLDSFLEQTGADIARANASILKANLARQEYDLRYAQAKVALGKSDYQGARDNLQRARERINQSLALQESIALRADSDRRLEQLGNEITRVENESVVREVRSLISSGRNYYYLGNFDQAEQLFIQAKTRWSATNVEDNAEIGNWLEIINTALSMKTGRSIPVSAPLYPQMSQILSSANQLYVVGRGLMTSGKRAEAITVLSSAREKLQQLQLVYPLNQDAGTLTLRIDQVIDPDSFKTFFSQRVEYIRLNYRTERQEAYSDLLDLYQINPSFPGLKGLLDEVEIYLGIRLPPPDLKAIARSKELTGSAQKIYEANTRSMFQIALNQLDEAIKLNPDNPTAIALKDRVQTAIGGQSVAVLSAEDEAKYQKAVQELQKGNKITASALVEQLIQNPKSRNSSKIIDLKKRIDSQL